MTAAASDPALDAGELDDLVRLARRPDAAGNPPDDHRERMPQTAYAAGDRVVPDPRNGHVYEATVAGTTATEQPAWPTDSGATVQDGTVTWQEAGLAPWTPTFALNAAAAEGWRWKAGRVAASHSSISLGGDRGEDTFKYLNCLRQAEHYAKRVFGSIPLARPR